MRHEPNCPQPKDFKPVLASGGWREQEALRVYLAHRGMRDQYDYYSRRLRYCPSCDSIEGLSSSQIINVGRWFDADERAKP